VAKPWNNFTTQSFIFIKSLWKIAGKIRKDKFAITKHDILQGLVCGAIIREYVP
jgi:hypothetical protein